jgi:hypothetical protein
MSEFDEKKVSESEPMSALLPTPNPSAFTGLASGGRVVQSISAAISYFK